ncbi:Hypothetical predicted protein [Octopus vulgaris]|uniref:Uncharacterized protein n=1 Tax=Octopus vulgaris TaxID=6645 RepID=A0AA36F117_OCTVU|nr:Hypothetical predicted protein [Octopus vulgaris]
MKEMKRVGFINLVQSDTTIESGAFESKLTRWVLKLDINGCRCSRHTMIQEQGKHLQLDIFTVNGLQFTHTELSSEFNYKIHNNFSLAMK